MRSRYNLRSRRSSALPGQRPSAGDGPSEPNIDRRPTLPMRLSLRRESMRAQVGSRRTSQLTVSTRTSGSSANSRSSRAQTSTNVTPAQVNPDGNQVQSTGNVSPSQRPQPKETLSATNTPTTSNTSKTSNTSNDNKGHKKVRWTTEMNKFLLKTFLELSGKHNKSSAYSKELRDRFVAKFPLMDHVTPEMVLRQKAKICNKHVLTKEDIEDVQKDIMGEPGPSLPTDQQSRPTTIAKRPLADETICEVNNNSPEGRQNSDTQLEYNFSNINNPDNDNEELPKLAQENQFTLNQDIPKHRAIE